MTEEKRDEELEFFINLLDGSEQSKKNLALILRTVVGRLDSFPQYEDQPILYREPEYSEETIEFTEDGVEVDKYST